MNRKIDLHHPARRELARRRRRALAALAAAGSVLAAAGVASAAKPVKDSSVETTTNETAGRSGKPTKDKSTKDTGSTTDDPAITTDSPTIEATTDESTTAAPSYAVSTETTGLDAADSSWDRTSLAEVTAWTGAERMWHAGYTGDGIDVAVIDTGVAPVAELSTTDVFVGPDLSFEGGVEEVAGLDTYGHGTHMAGIIAAKTPGADPLNRQPGDLFGVAPDAGIVSVKVADNTGAVDVSQVIAAIDWVVQHRNSGELNIRVLNLSYNTTGTQHYVDDPLSKAIENAWNHGIVVVVSAGNEGRGAHTLANPATNPHILAVSANELWQYGFYTPSWAPSGDGIRNPDLTAPGVSIMSLRVPGSRIDVEHPEGHVSEDERLFLGSGTSQSAAVVSGAAALLLQQRPNLTPNDVKSILTSSTTPTDEKTTLAGNGALNIATAMSTAPSDLADATPSTGLGSLEAARGDDHVTISGETLTGEHIVTGDPWDPIAWVTASESANAWTGADSSSDSTWSGSTWSGSTWSGSTWSGSTWSGSTWSGSTWSGSTWSGSSWSGSSWS